ncbi:sulfate permease, SulP family [Collimonas sp. OK607]|uniref:SulP family inorganic anion transporter n=1 Tax=Collimonas sp. OK607 TaxID=1798194 RepID=UPI0008F25F1E|nr:SulP family inorganic anion transporter [Collimonas sp. OK607]SFB05925.1 sulfate permease, SulP family [Collimonas sp. OK607]
MINILEARKAGLFARDKLLPNVIAGAIVGVVALPLSMAFAIASGARPEQGLYTAIVAGFVVSMFGGSRAQIAGPTGAFIVILAGITAKYGISGLQIATLMAGAMLLFMGVAKMGSVIKFIPAPVIVGFTTGIAVIIWVGQWKDFFGLPAIPAGHFHEKLWYLIEALLHLQLHPATTAIALLSLGLATCSSRLGRLKRIPGPLLALVGATMLQSIFHFNGVATIGSAFGEIPQHLPSLSMPAITMSQIVELIGPAFTIAMLGAIESLLSAVVADGMVGSKHDSNQELIGQGLANMVTPLFGGFAATGAIARTATSIRNGGSSPLAGIIHAIMLVLVIVFLAPLATNVPLAAFAAILFVVAYNMSEWRHFAKMMRRAPRADVIILLVTFLLTVLTDLVVAVNIGVILAIMQFMRRMASAVEVQHFSELELKAELAQHGWTTLPPGVLVYAIEGPVFFGAVENFERTLIHTHTDPRTLILRLRWVPFVDMTGLLTLEEVVLNMQKRGVRMILCEANLKVKTKLARAGLLELIGTANYHEDFALALSRSRELMENDIHARHIPAKISVYAENLIKTSKDFFLGGKD